MTVALPDATVFTGAATHSRRSIGVVFASTIGNALGVTPTVIAVFGVFLVAIAAEFHWPRAEVSGALAAASVANALATPLAGRASDRFGARRTLLVGSLLLGLLIVSLALARSNALLFYAQFVLIGVAGALPSGMLYAKLIAEWYETRRGLWIGVAGGVGNGLGATILPLLAGGLLPYFGWRTSFASMGLLVIAVGLPIQLFFLRNAPVSRAAFTEVFEGVSARRALRSRDFWLLATALPVGGGCLIGLFSMIVPIVTDRGFSIDVATGVIAAFALVCAIWEPTVGFILDRSSRPRILAPFYWIAALGILVLLYAPSVPLLLASGVMLALGLGAESSALSFLLSRYFGRHSLGTISGVAFAIMLGAGASTMILLNAAYDVGAGYRVAVLAMIPLLLWNGISVTLLGRYPYTVETDTPMAEA